MRKPFFAQALFNLFDIQTDALSKYAASESRRSNNKVAMFDNNGNCVHKGSQRHRELYPEDFD